MSLAQVSDEQLSEAIKMVEAIIPRLDLVGLHKIELSISNIRRHNNTEARAFVITALVLKWEVALRNALRYDYVKEVVNG